MSFQPYTCYTCRYRIKYQNDGHSPDCTLAAPHRFVQQPSRARKCTCGNHDDLSVAFPELHSDWCREDNK